MPICVAVPKEKNPEERRIALVPETLMRLNKLGATVLIEQGFGQSAHLMDTAYPQAEVINEVEQLYQRADIVLKVRPPLETEIAQMKTGTVVIGFMTPHQQPERIAQLRDHQITSFAMELIPRISRAQTMDALSSQASVAGYKAVLMGADLADVFFPMLTTAAGTIRPAKVLVIGAGVAGLQAIATARRLGAMVEAYDVRAATKEQVQSLGAKFIDIAVKAEGEGGYARELTEQEKQQQQAILAEHIAAANVVITTAAVPGRSSPKIITQAMVENMAPGAVIIDIAAEGGGNCVLSQPGQKIVHQDVIIYAPLNVPSQTPRHASEMYAKNLFNLLTLMIQAEQLQLNWEDEVIAGSVLTHGGEIKHAPTRQLVEGVSA